MTVVSSIDWDPVRAFVHRVSAVPTTITAGSPEWVALADDDPAKLAAVLIAGSRWVLEYELDLIDQRRAAEKDAAVTISRALDWARTAKRIRDRDQWYRDHPYLQRKAS